jgi:hypothetical protein
MRDFFVVSPQGDNASKYLLEVSLLRSRRIAPGVTVQLDRVACDLYVFVTLF